MLDDVIALGLAIERPRKCLCMCSSSHMLTHIYFCIWASGIGVILAFRILLQNSEHKLAFVFYLFYLLFQQRKSCLPLSLPYLFIYSVFLFVTSLLALLGYLPSQVFSILPIYPMGYCSAIANLLPSPRAGFSIRTLSSSWSCKKLASQVIHVNSKNKEKSVPDQIFEG